MAMYSKEASGDNPNGLRSGAMSTTVAPTETRSADEIVAAAMPELASYDLAQQRRLQEALIACRSGGPDAAKEQKLRAAFQLYEEELLSRGDICAIFAIDVRQFMDYAAAFAPDDE
jgi:hypothetical protein